jgi:hypothetical protein
MLNIVNGIKGDNPFNTFVADFFDNTNYFEFK